jgi:hypothetical protein
VDSIERNGDDAQQVEALCVAQGMPAELLPNYSNSSIVTTVGGNPDLGPETADTVTAGIVIHPAFDSAWIRDLQFTIDWYRIEIDDVVTFVDAATAVRNCYDPSTTRPLRPTITGARCSAAIQAPGKSSTHSRRTETWPRRRHPESTSSLTGPAVGPGALAIGWYVGWLDEFSLQTTNNFPRTSLLERLAALPAPIRNGNGLPACVTH